MMNSILSVAGLIAAASAFTQPTAQTFGALLTPDLASPVTTGQTYSITWTPSTVAGQTVSLVLCNGPGANCVLQSAAIVEGVSASAGSYSWSVPCSLPAGTQQTDSGYGMLIIVDGTGEFQYSTQFSVLSGSSCSSTSSTTSGSSSSSSSSSSPSSSSSTLTSTSSGTAPVSGAPTGYPTSSGWYGWSSTFNTTTTPAYTASSKYTTTASAVVTSKPVEASSSGYTKPSSTAAAATTSASLVPYTGAAAVSAAFANVVGVVGAAMLAMLAL